MDFSDAHNVTRSSLLETSILDREIFIVLLSAVKSALVQINVFIVLRIENLSIKGRVIGARGILKKDVRLLKGDVLANNKPKVLLAGMILLLCRLLKKDCASIAKPVLKKGIMLIILCHFLAVAVIILLTFNFFVLIAISLNKIKLMKNS